MDLASKIESDGGMPGKHIEERILSSILALLCFLEKGYNSKTGTFRLHVQRLISFLESELGKSSSSKLAPSLDKIVKLARNGRALGGGWCELPTKPRTDSDTKDLWAKIDAKLQEVTKP